MKLNAKIFLMTAAICLLAGCADAPPAAETPQLTLAEVQPLTLNVGKIEVVNHYVPPMRAPNVDHLFRQTPVSLTEALIDKKLVAGGAPDRVLRAIIEDASVTRTDLKVDDSFTGMFQKQPAERYHAHVALRFELVNSDAPDIVLAHAQIGSDHEKTLNNDASPADRDDAYFAMDEAFVKDLDSGMNDIVKKSFGMGQ